MGESEARTLAEKLLAEALPQRWRHVQAVAAVVDRVSTYLDLDRRVVVSAAWLHDIGYAAALVDTGFHPLDGARYLRQRRWDDEVCCLVAHHTDAACQAGALGLTDGLLSQFADATGIASDVLWLADATTGPNGDPMTLDERIAEVAQRYGSSSSVSRGLVASRHALAAAIASVDERLEEAAVHA